MPLIAGFGVLIHTKSRRTKNKNIKFVIVWDYSLKLSVVLQKL